ncbi:hypothetical protein AAFF_G00092640 [Aldrovandia affinis]|uniref:Uncharacterized protein n=1 Tax=Aldrovandia affinis TaxID=143900 RepID=A0AAD7T3D7_9TELE|nr:hypothetical protein AAFF_G00092640 [Aldrovandia affinis]
MMALRWPGGDGGRTMGRGSRVSSGWLCQSISGSANLGSPRVGPCQSHALSACRNYTPASNPTPQAAGASCGAALSRLHDPWCPPPQLIDGAHGTQKCGAESRPWRWARVITEERVDVHSAEGARQDQRFRGVRLTA